MLVPLLLIGTLAFIGIKTPSALRPYWTRITLATLICALFDWALLATLTKLGLSYGEVELPRFLIHLVRIALLALTLALLFLTRRNARAKKLLSFVGVILQISILLGESYALYIEPFNLGTTVLGETAPQFIDGRPLRIVQLSDLHVERITRREEAVLAEVNALAPDIIVLTGDYVNIDYRFDPQTHADTREVLAQFSAPYGVYAISGSPPVDIPEAMEAVFTDLDIQLLDNEIATIALPNHDLHILGVSVSHDLAYDREVVGNLMSTLTQEDYTLLLYHSPDVMESATASGIDLYLAGHTHGGQIRLPFYGAIITSSVYGKEFEMGRYSRAATTLYVSRGIGMEGLNFPRARFLSPPEVVLIELGQ
jgi:predicted MPP superfamily phosphohydrolase